MYSCMRTRRSVSRSGASREVKRAHLAAVVGAAAHHVRRGRQQLHVAGRSVAQREEDGLRPGNRPLDALEAARRLRARRQEAEAHAALLLAIGDQPGGPGIAALQSPAQRMLSETRLNSTAWTLPMTVHPCGISSGSVVSRPPNVSDPTSGNAVQVGDRNVRRIGRVDDGVEGLDGDELARANRTQDRFLHRDRKPGRLGHQVGLRAEMRRPDPSRPTSPEPACSARSQRFKLVAAAVGALGGNMHQGSGRRTRRRHAR